MQESAGTTFKLLYSSLWLSYLIALNLDITTLSHIYNLINKMDKHLFYYSPWVLIQYSVMWIMRHCKLNILNIIIYFYYIIKVESILNLHLIPTHVFV